MQQRFANNEQGLARRHFIGGSDARIIMGQEDKALIRLWQEKRGEVGPEDLSSAP
jgi:predicted phage-related endonuclease